MKIIPTLVSLALAIAAVTSHRMHPLSDEFIDFINSKQTLWRAGRNFHRHTPLKYLKRLAGTIKDNATFNDRYAGKPPLYKHTKPPRDFDARSKWNHCRSLNEIRDQGACGSCWAVAAVSTMTDRLCIQTKGRKKVHFSELDLMSCCMFCGNPCNGGALEKAWKYGRLKGIVSGGEYNSHEGCKPYTIPPCEHGNKTHFNGMPPCGHTIPNTVCKHECEPSYKKKYNADRRKLYTYYTNTKIMEIMSDIQKNGPVSTAFLLHEDFLNYKSGIYSYVSGAAIGWHSVKLLGWGEESGVKYWLAANSWNSDWGDRGFFKIIRGNNHLGIEDVMYAGLFKVKPKRH